MRHVACAVFGPERMLCTDSPMQRCEGERRNHTETPNREDRSTFSVAIVPFGNQPI